MGTFLLSGFAMLSGLFSNAVVVSETSNKTMEKKTAEVLHAPESKEEEGTSKYGTFGGEVGTYWQAVDTKDTTDREEFGNANLTLHYVTPKWEGLSLELGALYNLELRDKDDIYDGVYQKEGLISEAFVKWETDGFSLFAGRMPIDYLLLGDYIDGLALSVTAIEDLEIRAVWAKNQAVLDPDDVSDFEKLNNSDGIFGIEFQYQVTDGLSITLAEYYANNLANQTGFNLVHECGNDKVSNSFVAEAYHVNDLKPEAGDENGHVWHLNDTITFGEIFSLGAGYIETAKKTGAAGLFNNPYDPFEEDTIEELANASVWYVTGGIVITDDIALTTTYGQKRFDNLDAGQTDQIDESDIVLGIQVTENLGLDLAYINYRQEKDNNWDKVWGYLTYSF